PAHLIDRKPTRLFRSRHAPAMQPSSRQ
ncbi:hypothetical protein WJX84_007524, partial [Apatococcus fuscideae]